VLIVLDAGVVRRDFPVAYANWLLGESPADAAGRTPSWRADLPDGEAQALARQEREKVEAAIGAHLDLARPLDHRPDGEAVVRATTRVVQAADLDHIRSMLLGSWGADSARRMGTVPLTILALGLLSLVGALVASFRARSRELGVLRSCGLTRAGLLRLALGESLLIGLSALIVGLAGGAAAALALLRITTLIGYEHRGMVGLVPQFIMPWTWLWPGLVLCLVVCALAALWAGWRTGRTPPASLVAAGPRLS
jgi:hypothetical protein